MNHRKCGTCKYYLPDGHEPDDMGVCGYPEESLDEIDDIQIETFAVDPAFVIRACNHYEKEDDNE